MIKAERKSTEFGECLEFKCVKCGGVVRSFIEDGHRLRFHLCNAAYLILRNNVVLLKKSASQIIAEAVNGKSS